MNTPPTLKFNLPVATVDLIGNALAQLPYHQVKDTIDLLVMQANNPDIQSMIVPPKLDQEVQAPQPGTPVMSLK